MKNRVVVLLVSGLLVFSMIGCGSDAKQAQSSDVVVETETQLAENSEVVGSTEIEEVAETTEEVVENTELVAEEEPVEDAMNPYNVVDCETMTKYTNTGANIRSIPDKSGELLDTVSLNTQMTVTGTTEDGSWSRVEHGGLVCYIKSSLLSDTKTSKPASGSGSSSSSGSSQTSNSSGGTSSSDSSSGSSSGSSQSEQDVQDLMNSLWGDGSSKAGDSPITGTTGNVSDRGYGGGH